MSVCLHSRGLHEISAQFGIIKMESWNDLTSIRDYSCMQLPVNGWPCWLERTKKWFNMKLERRCTLRIWAATPNRKSLLALNCTFDSIEAYSCIIKYELVTSMLFFSLLCGLSAVNTETSSARIECKIHLQRAGKILCVAANWNKVSTKQKPVACQFKYLREKTWKLARTENPITCS